MILLYNMVRYVSSDGDDDDRSVKEDGIGRRTGGKRR